MSYGFGFGGGRRRGAPPPYEFTSSTYEVANGTTGEAFTLSINLSGTLLWAIDPAHNGGGHASINSTTGAVTITAGITPEEFADIWFSVTNGTDLAFSSTAAIGIVMTGAVFGAALPAGLTFDWNVEDLTGFVNNDTVQNFPDSVSGIVFSQATSGSRPTYKTGGINGKPYFQTSGTRFMTCTVANQGALKTVLDSQEYTIIAVSANAADVTGMNCVFGEGGSGKIHLMHRRSGSQEYVGMLNTTSGGAIATGLPSYQSFGYTSSKTYGFNGNTNLQRYYNRGLCFHSFNGSLLTLTSNATLGLLAMGNGTFITNINFYRLMIWNRALSPLEMLEAETYLNNQFSQTHPTVAKGKLLVIDGDSRSCNVGYTPDVFGTTATGYSGIVASGLSFNAGEWMNLSTGGATIQNCIGAAPAEIDAVAAQLGVPVRLIYEESFNSRALSQGDVATSGTFRYQQKQYGTARKAALGTSSRVVICSPVDHADANSPQWGANGWAAYCEASFAEMGFDGCAKVWSGTALGGDSACPNTAPWTPWSDGVHLTSAGQTTQANKVVADAAAVSGW